MVDEPQIGAFLCVLARAGGVILTAPVIGDGGVSARAKLVAVVAIAGAVCMQREGVPLADAPFVAILELATGALSGMVARLALVPVGIAGQLSGLSLGLGFAAEYDVRAGESASTLRTLMMTFAGLAFLACGGLEAIVRCVAAGPASPFAVGELGTMAMDNAVDAMGRGLALAAPIVLAGLVGNIGLGLINRAAPAANVFAISLSAVLVLGGVVLLTTAPSFVAGVTDLARAAVDSLIP
jgi:flagellar biosynthesis protein FliR